MNILNLKQFYKNYRVHIIGWSAYIAYEVFVAGIIRGTISEIGEIIFAYTLNISLFYFHAYLYKNELERKNKSIKFITIPLLAIFETILYTVMTYCFYKTFMYLHFIKHREFSGTDIPFIGRCIYRSILFIGFGTGYVYIIKSFEDRKKVEALERQSLVTQIEKQTLENDLVQSQNNYLRSQINPHFLFNTLNFIYNDARKKAPMAADAIMNLSEMMRYALKRPEASELVPLSEEIEQIEHLINLHKLRTANTLNLDLEINGDLFGIRFPPLILLTLVENIFKHGNIAHSTQPALITVSYDGTTLNITTINMVNDVKSKKIESHHVGLENITKRLSTFYKDDYVFRYYKDPQNRYITEIVVTVVNPLANLNT